VGVTAVELWVEGQRFTAMTQRSIGLWSTTIDTRKYPSGVYRFTLRAYDEAGNEGVSPSISYIRFLG